MGQRVTSYVMPSCMPPKKKFDLKNPKMKLKEQVFFDENESIRTCSDTETVFHTPKGMGARSCSDSPDSTQIEGKLGGITTRAEGKYPTAVHGQLSALKPPKITEIPGSNFNLRIGPNYSIEGKKAASGPALYNLRAVDIIEHKRKIAHISRFFDRSEVKLDEKEDVTEGGYVNGLPRFFIVTYMLPSYAPGFFSSSKRDGHGYTVIFCFVLSKRSLVESKDTKGAIKVLRKFCAVDPNVSDKQRGKNLWKNIVKVVNYEKLGLGMFLNQYIKRYNAKPWLSRNPDMHKFKGDNYYEVDLDIHVYNLVGLKFMHSLQPYVPTLVLDIGFCVQSEEDDEMPETILGCIRLSDIRYDKDSLKVNWDMYSKRF
eukprot:CAMPEP_0167749498 /NCGR_PEP_ID=MMETSP0110_2-20121227/5442_1 /TAXON_ID=629695 /ORGANISM="Gymnochlora sp., Strain CCMP2014" /LENGTH=369 /DNA_ID=CAMNT_0007634661 /DNA_START=52 /DNA_END=1161 /DNA_ORIENTATION=+